MSKMSELSLAIRELKRCGETLIAISDSLDGLFSNNEDSPSANRQIADTPELKENPITLEAVRAVLAEKSRVGHTAEIRELLEKHGAGKLSEIDPSKYPVLLAEAEVLGNG
ncbi:DNA ligase [Dehalobacter sp.]|uniref:DNA ligase n=1 Tax=Dehalobacter sp. TaxID=1962289 RepID=UPI0025871C44|nr:DNA ligase [Dehalobacter sp.]MCG1024517.1 DNA ligase [Dehalobacter sp.]